MILIQFPYPTTLILHIILTLLVLIAEVLEVYQKELTCWYF